MFFCVFFFGGFYLMDVTLVDDIKFFLLGISKVSKKDMGGFYVWYGK